MSYRISGSGFGKPVEVYRIIDAYRDFPGFRADGQCRIASLPMNRGCHEVVKSRIASTISSMKSMACP